MPLLAHLALAAVDNSSCHANTGEKLARFIFQQWHSSVRRFARLGMLELMQLIRHARGGKWNKCIEICENSSRRCFINYI